MKKLFYTLTLLFVTSIIFISCSNSVAVESVTLSPAKFSIAMGDSAVTLTATIYPTNATDHTVVWTSSDPNIATVDDYGQVTAVAEGTATITVTTTSSERTTTSVVTVTDHVADPAGVVINGIRWATRNVDAPGTFAANPEDAGMFFQWNRRVGWGVENSGGRNWFLSRENSAGGRNWNRSTPTGTTWTTANSPCPTGWRIPTQAEITNLENQPHIWTQRNGVYGRLLGLPPNQIFLPAVGHITRNGAVISMGSSGIYWSSTRSGSAFAYSFGFGAGDGFVDLEDRTNGLSVRCVATN
jgi:hypothetical protein